MMGRLDMGARRARPTRTHLRTSDVRGLAHLATEATAGVADIAEGVTVEHERFGRGKVLKIEGRSPDLKATVFFPSAGQKQLLLRFAKLRVVEG